MNFFQKLLYELRRIEINLNKWTMTFFSVIKTLVYFGTLKYEIKYDMLSFQTVSVQIFHTK